MITEVSATTIPVGNLNMAFEAPEPLCGMTYAEMAARSLDFWLQGEDLPDQSHHREILEIEGRWFWQCAGETADQQFAVTEFAKRHISLEAAK